MTENKALVLRGGRFTDVDSLLPLFTDPDARGTRRWREAFGLAGSHTRRREDHQVTIRGRLLSSVSRRSERGTGSGPPTPISF